LKWKKPKKTLGFSSICNRKLFEIMQCFFPFVQIDTFLKVFPKVKHGWTVKYNMDNHEEVAEAEAAHQMMFSWFDNYLTGNQVLPSLCPFNGNGSLTTSIPQVDLNSNGSVTTSTPEVLP
jgi:hypothetical protein